MPLRPRRLLLLPDPAFDPARDIAAAPWVLFDARWTSNWHQQSLPPDPYPSLDLMQADAASVRAHTEALLPRIADELNRRNTSGHNLAFWRVMTMPWLLSFAQLFIERLRRVRDLVQAFGDEPLQAKLCRGPEHWGFVTTADLFNHGAFDPQFNAWLMSEILRDQVPSSWTVVWQNAQPKKSPDIASGRKLKLFIASRCRGNVGLGLAEKVACSFILSRGHRRPPRIVRTAPAGSFPDAERFWTLLWKVLPSYLETLRDWAPSTPPSSSGRVMITTELYFSPQEKYLAARRAEAGERIVSVQHGSGYGNTALFSLINAVEYAQDRFISWGWLNHQGHDVRALPLPSPYLSKFRRQLPGSDIIFVGGFMSPFPYRLDSRPQPAQFAACATDKLNFLKALPDGVQKHVRYRGVPPQPGAYDDAALVMANIHGMRLCEGDLHGQLMKAALVVLDNPGTTLNITMAANVPTLAFWDRNLWRMTAESERHFDRLRAAGILHDDPHAAARHLRAMSDDIEGWWASPATQEARAAWTQGYARVSPHWRRAWFSALKDL
jgi:hypothetical protein